MDDSRDFDKKVKLIPPHGSGLTHRQVSLDTLKSAFIAEGLSVSQIAERYALSESQVQKIVDEAKLPELRKLYIKEGLSKIQNTQIDQASKLMDLENSFKKLRIQQLEKQLEDFLAYFGRHNDFYKRHPVSGEILKDLDGIPMQIHIPNISKEINNLKESVTLSDGLKKLLTDIDSIINPQGPRGEVVGEDPNVIEMDEFDGLFRKKS